MAAKKKTSVKVRAKKMFKRAEDLTVLAEAKTVLGKAQQKFEQASNANYSAFKRGK